MNLNLFQHGFWEIFESEWRELLAGQRFSRANRRVVQGVNIDTAMLWRVLDFYSLIAAILPPDDVVSVIMHEKTRIALRQYDRQIQTNRLAHGGAALLRHSRFNPKLLKKRIAEAEGVYIQAQKTDKL